MADIFTFSKMNESRETFLRDDELLSYGEIGKEATFPDFELPISPSPESLATRDWSNQERANLYRVKRLLEQAGIHCETDGGISDEGDPWFVYCRFDGEVFIHICRIGDVYLLDSPNIHAPLYGNSFNDLVNSFSGAALSENKGANAETQRRVVKLQRDGKVFLHPSSLLAALALTLYLASDELVFLSQVQASWNLDDEDLSDADLPLIADPTQVSALEAALLDYAALDSGVSDTSSNFLREICDLTGLQLKQINYTYGLSVIAVAFGFFASESLVTFRDTLENKALALLGLSVSDDGEVDNQVAAFALNKAAADDALQSFQERDTASEDDRSEIASAADPEDQQLALDLLVPDEATASTGQDADDLVHQDVVATVRDAEHAVDLGSENIVVRTTEAAPLVEPHPSEPLNPQSYVQLASSFTLQIADTIETFALSESDLLAYETVLIKEDSLDALQVSLGESGQDILEPIEISLLTTPDTPEVVSTPDSFFAKFGVQARAFIDFILSKSDNVEMITTETEIILMDFDAVTDSRNDIYARSWALGDTGVISMVGLRSEFEMFDLVA